MRYRYRVYLSELAQRVGTVCKCDDPEKIIQATLDVIASEMSSGRSVTLVNFGKFDTTSRQGRTGRDPRTGRPILVPALTVPRFRPAAALKSAVNGP